MRVRELSRLADVRAAAAGDPLVVWAAQGMRPGVRAWAAGEAVAVASPGLSCRDRLAVHGSAADAAVLVRHALAEAGPTYRPIGAVPLVEALVATVDGLALVDRFSWMDTAAPVAVEPAAAWLTGAELDAVAALLDLAFPTSYARPGRAGVRRWAGVRDATGRLVATAADAWSAPGCGFLAGVATHPDARGQGHAAAACGLVVTALIRGYRQAALIVDDWNTAAVALYHRLGFGRRPVAAAQIVGAATS